MVCLLAAGWVSSGRGRWVRHSSFTGKSPAESTGYITEDMASGRFKWVVVPYGESECDHDWIYDEGYATSLGEARREADKAIRELEAIL